MEHVSTQGTLGATRVEAGRVEVGEVWGRHQATESPDLVAHSNAFVCSLVLRVRKWYVVVVTSRKTPTATWGGIYENGGPLANRF